jgi:hypothetical protein
MGGKAGVIAVTRAADFFLDGRHLKVPTDAMVGHVRPKSNVVPEENVASIFRVEK